MLKHILFAVHRSMVEFTVKMAGRTARNALMSVYLASKWWDYQQHLVETMVSTHHTVLGERKLLPVNVRSVYSEKLKLVRNSFVDIFSQIVFKTCKQSQCDKFRVHGRMEIP